MDRGLLPGRNKDVTIGEIKGSAVKTIWVCLLLSLFSMVAYSRISAALNDAGEPRSETPALPCIAATPLSTNTPAGAMIARDASSGSPAPGSIRNDNHVPANLCLYVFLHKTWTESDSVPTTAGLSACPE